MISGWTLDKLVSVLCQNVDQVISFTVPGEHERKCVQIHAREQTFLCYEGIGMSIHFVNDSPGFRDNYE